jgi:hypothetical protein
MIAQIKIITCNILLMDDYVNKKEKRNKLSDEAKLENY